MVAVSISLQGCVMSLFYGFDASDTLILGPVPIPSFTSSLALGTAQHAVKTLRAELVSTRAERGRRTRSGAPKRVPAITPQVSGRARNSPALVALRGSCLHGSRGFKHIPQPFHRNELDVATVPGSAQKGCR